MQLYAWSGQRSAALQQYRDCVRILEEELGVPPLAETTQLYQAIQEERLEQPSLPPASQPVIPPAPPPPIPLIGRQQELQTLNRWYKQVGPDGRFMVISGEMGIGKTRLAEQFQHELGPAVTLHARCYQGETRLAYAPFIQAMRQALHQPEAQEKLQNVAAPWLAEAGRLLPELVEWFPQLPGAPPLDWPGTPGRFLEGLSQVLLALLTGRSPGLLWLDDGQWADTASLDLLAFLARRWQGRPYLILVCWRGGDLPADYRLHQLLAEARRDGIGTEIHLTRLSADDVKELFAFVRDN
jgi:predicted ATPase